jgi:hypothetical protein
MKWGAARIARPVSPKSEGLWQISTGRFGRSSGASRRRSAILPGGSAETHAMIRWKSGLGARWRKASPTSEGSLQTSRQPSTTGRVLGIRRSRSPGNSLIHRRNPKLRDLGPSSINRGRSKRSSSHSDDDLNFPGRTPSYARKETA